MDVSLASFAFLLVVCCLVPDVLTDCHGGDACSCTPKQENGDRFPKHAMKWTEFENLLVGGQSKEYFELYNLKPEGQFPDLTKVIYRWQKPGEVYINPLSGWFNDYNFCYNNSINFYRYEDDNVLRFKPHSTIVLFKFDIVLPEAGLDYVGTLFSSCPDRYLINWFCPKTNLTSLGFSDQYCSNGLQMSLTTSTKHDKVPWHLIAKDLCRNKAPPLDDIRWHFTYEGKQCELNLSSQSRKKRDLSFERSLWP